MKSNLIKIAIGMILAVGSAQAADTRTFANGYYFQNVNEITGNATKNSGSLAGRITVITTDQRWTSDTIYILNNLTFVEAPATLTIEPGTIIRGEPVTTGGSSTLDPADPGSLIICRGAKIVAQGTAESPIYFTSISDPFVPGGEKTIPTVLPANSLPTSDYNTAAYNGSFKAHNVDAQWGGLTILGRAPVGFGGPSTNSGNLQIAIAAYYNTNGAVISPQSYTRNPTFSFSNISNVGTNNLSATGWAGSSGFNLEALFNPVGVSGLTNGNSGTFTKFPGTSLKATVADGSRTATKTLLDNVPVYVTNVASTSNVTANYTNIGQVLASGDTVVLNWGAATFSNRGLQYNVPTKKDTAPFLSTYGYSGAEIALELTSGAAFSSAAVPTSLTNVASVLPSAQLVLSNTYLYGVIVKAPKPSTWNGTDVPTITITGSSLNNASATASISGSAVSDPSAIPLKGGIGANFIEGFQAIDGAAYGLGTNPTVDSDGFSWTTFSGGIYGGSNPNDNSGCIRFCRFSFGGYVLSPNNEINGVTYGGAGSGTVTEFVEVFNNADDDFEMFGGYNNLKYVAGIFGGDDGFDTDMGYRGKGQFMFQLQNNTKAGAIATGRPTANIGDNLGENDGNEDPNTIANDAYPGTEFTYFNLTAIGVGYNVNGSFPSDRSGPNFKDNSGGKILDAVYVEAPSGAIQDQSTTTNTVSGGRRTWVAPYAPMVANEPQGVIAYNTWSKCGGGKSAAGLTNSAAFTNTAANGPLFPQTSGRTSSGGGTINNSVAVNKTLVTDLSNLFVGSDVVVSTGTNGRLNGVDPVLASGANERSNGTNPRNSIAVATNEITGIQPGVTVDRGTFFAANTFRGAFRDFNWMKGWSLADQLGVFANNNVVVPDVTLTRDGSGNVVANFTGASGILYNIEVSSDNKTYLPFSTETGAGAPILKNLARSGLIFVRVTPL
jgi:hypothetical protein